MSTIYRIQSSMKLKNNDFELSILFSYLFDISYRILSFAMPLSSLVFRVSLFVSPISYFALRISYLVIYRISYLSILYIASRKPYFVVSLLVSPISYFVSPLFYFISQFVSSVSACVS